MLQAGPRVDAGSRIQARVGFTCTELIEAGGFYPKFYVISIFCAKNRMTTEVLFYHSQQYHHARGKLVPGCICNIV